MASSAPDVAESSRSREEAEKAAESEPKRKWVALVSAAVLLGNEDERAKAMAIDNTGLRLELGDPPLPSYLVLHPRAVAPHHRRKRNDGPLSAYILAADRSACILLQVVDGDDIRDFFLCDTQRNTVTILPPTEPGIHLHPDLSIGLIADAHHPGHHVVAQLQPTTSVNWPNRLLYYSTAKGHWILRGLDQQLAPMRKQRNPFSETGVLAHDGRLWWIALADGVFFCDPCTPLREIPQLRFLPLPGHCEMEGDVAFDPRIRTLIDERRCVRPSQGKLRFVEIRGLSYDEHDDVPAANPTVWMWTLNDPEAADPKDAWTLAYEVAFAEIWASKTYADARLLPRVVPHVALVDPDNHFVVYFFQGSKLFGFDMRDMKLVACKDCVIDRDQLSFRSSRPIVDAWEVLPPPPELAFDDDDSSPDEQLGTPCRRLGFCTVCHSAVCLLCCPDHNGQHHGAAGATLRIYQTKDGTAIDARDLKVHGMGFDWRFIDRNIYLGRKCITLSNPRQNKRKRGEKCLQCNLRVKAGSYYCSPGCKAQHKPDGQSTTIINALVGEDFNQTAVVDQLCTICMRSFASAHCTDHEVHHNEHDAVAPPPPPQAPPADE